MMYIRLTAILLAIFAAVSYSYSQINGWDLRFFPTPTGSTRLFDGTNYLFQTDVVVSQVWHAIDERAWAATGDGSSLDVNQLPVRRHETSLQYAKNEVAFLIPNYVDSIFYNNNIPNITNEWIRMYSVTGIIDQLNLPTNFFVYTPIRNLMGVNSNVNSLSTWSDGIEYGWEKLRLVVTNLKWTVENGGVLEYSDSESIYSSLYWPEYDEDNPPCPGSGNVYFDDSLPVNISVESLPFTNYVNSIQSYEEFQSRIVDASGSPYTYEFGWPTNIFDYIVSLATEYIKTADWGYYAAHLRQSNESPLFTNAHVAHTFRFPSLSAEVAGEEPDGSDYTLSDLLEECGIETNDFVFYQGSISTRTLIESEYLFLTGSQFSPSFLACSACSLMAQLDGDYSRVDATEYSFLYDEIAPGYSFRANTATMGYRGINRPSFKHVIAWDFRFK